MKTRILFVSLLAATFASAAIKKAELPEATPKSEAPAPRPPVKPEPPASPLDQYREGKQPGPDEMSALLRMLLEGMGVPKDKLEDAGLAELLEMMREQGGRKGLDFKGLDDLRDFFAPMDPKVQRKLDDQFRSLLDGHRPGTVEAAKSTFHLRDGKKPAQKIALATCVQPGGWLLTKASEAHGRAQLECLIERKWLPAKIARTWKEHDLALIKVDANNLPAIQWSAAPPPVVGSFITAAAPTGSDPVAIGVVSVAPRGLQEKGRGFLGVQLDADDKGVKIREVIPGSAALKHGVKKDDRVLEVDGRKPDSIFNFTRLVSDRKAGDKVKLKLQRGEEIQELEVILGDRADRPGAGASDRRTDRMNAMGSTISERKGEFPSVLQTDFPLDASQCGGPVTDLDGNVIGLVIARSGRVETLVLPSTVIRDLLAGVDFTQEAVLLSSPRPAATGGPQP